PRAVARAEGRDSGPRCSRSRTPRARRLEAGLEARVPHARSAQRRDVRLEGIQVRATELEHLPASPVVDHLIDLLLARDDLLPRLVEFRVALQPVRRHAI